MRFVSPRAASRSARRADRAATEHLMARLNEYRQRAADLLFEAYAVDLGGET